MSNIPEFPDLDPEGEHTAESLEQTLHEYATAVRQEFELAQTDVAAEDNAVKFSENFAKKNLGVNLAQLQWLAQNSTSDSVRANAAKYLVELARSDAEHDGDPIKELLGKLNKPKKVAAIVAGPTTPTEAMIEAMNEDDDDLESEVD